MRQERARHPIRVASRTSSDSAVSARSSAASRGPIPVRLGSSDSSVSIVTLLTSRLPVTPMGRTASWSIPHGVLLAYTPWGIM